MPFHPQQRDLLGDESKHENNDRRGQHEYRHVREAPLGEIGVEVIAASGEKEKEAHRQKHSEGRKQGRNFGNDEQEPYAVSHQANLALAGAVERLNRDILYRESRTQERQS